MAYVTVLPSIITLLNGICGFAAIAFASHGQQPYSFHRIDFSSNLAVAAYLIFVAMVADMLDGRVARMSHTTSSFGGQLDSLCDVISFGVAPAFLVLKVLETKFVDLVNPGEPLVGMVLRFIWLAAGVYVVCAILRLARFNVENAEDETAHMTFTGLPTPAAAGVLASLFLFHEETLKPIAGRFPVFAAAQNSVVYVLPFAAIALGVLMISRIRYPHMVNQYLRGNRPLRQLLWPAAIFAVIWLFGLSTALMVSFVGFAASGFLHWLYVRAVLNRGTEQALADGSGAGSNQPRPSQQLPDVRG